MLFCDPTIGILFGDVEVDGRFFIHSILVNPDRPSSVKRYRRVLDELEAQLRERGLDRYYTMADSESGFRFNQLVGFESNFEVWDDVYEVMVKEI